MLIDWFTVGAQALNFIVLVGLMKRLLYRPILRAIDTREKKNRRRARGRRQEEDGSPKAAGRVPAQERRDRPTAVSPLLKEGIDAANAERQRLLEATHGRRPMP